MEVGLLGPVQVLDADGEPIEVAGARQRALLALLALRPGAAVPSGQLIEELWPVAGQPAVLVVDNCEHVVDDAARLVDDLLQQAPDLQVPATSREALQVPGEVACFLAAAHVLVL